MIPALELLSDVRLTSLYALRPDQADSLEAYAQMLDFAFLRADLIEEIGQTEQLEKIGQDLKFPSWYGANLDALHDCLTDLSWQSARGYILLIQGIEEVLTSPETESLREVLTSVIEFWQAQETPFWVFFETSNPSANTHLQKIEMWK